MAQTDKKMGGREREECPGVMQSFVLARLITFGFPYMNPNLIG